jgi:glutamine synthetase
MFATSAAVRAIARREISRTAAPTGIRAMANLAAYEDYGKNVFTGSVADEYLKKHGASGDLLKDPSWVKTSPDIVANAVFDW